MDTTSLAEPVSRLAGVTQAAAQIGDSFSGIEVNLSTTQSDLNEDKAHQVLPLITYTHT